ncbi:elongation factor 1-delta-like isoform X1 [Betta splendens]|uniref:Elongation factor 1-delta-like isoform X1 n=1 Tax=Betta splendens TaxID=158456 RepID=A0A6P7KW12_BETSP|nr:elongation factor 1-delta-like isoform X1 [Betta splendens]XP_040923996.1 elongation factor 1-delta-like isoform X1 [Betta splendens]XP_055359844.1 elongation factor 1-delta-like isoform X1 [Betta splendens]XP_055359845.1 elongation factor 1-delta-like isoform X1 [Betta splendens]XP_055359846.1 elongation factor 1-delta-like isoform X1 [Betta splendens]XP_055359847.1 elongation factor 1-delta-like isoform X1 [Betta splendens]
MGQHQSSKSYDQPRYNEVERRLYEGADGPATQQQQVKTALQQAKGRQQKRPHRNFLNAGDQELVSRMKSLELENQTLHKVVLKNKTALQRLEYRAAVLEKSPAPAAVLEKSPAPAAVLEKSPAPAAVPCANSYGAMSSILLDVKPWDDETDMAKLEECVRSVQMDGLLWGASKLVPVGYGIKKLQIGCVVEDDKVGIDILEEEITKFEDFVQSVDVAALNKI